MQLEIVIYSNSSQTRGLFSAVLLSLSRKIVTLENDREEDQTSFASFRTANFLCTCLLWGLWMRNKPLTEEVLTLKFIFGRFSILGVQTTTMVTEWHNQKASYARALKFLLYTFSFALCKTTWNLCSNWRFYGERKLLAMKFTLKTTRLKYISRLEETNNLISKLNKLRYWKKYQKFR